MILEFSVCEQTLTAVATNSIPRRRSRGYLRLHLIFAEDWDNFAKTVYIQHEDYSTPIILEEDGEVEVPEYYTRNDHFLISVVGINGDTSCPTNALCVTLDESGMAWTTEPPDTDAPAYQKMLAMVQQVLALNEETVRYGEAQELTEAQKAQARENIAAVPVSRTVAGKALTGNVTLTASDIQYQGAIDGGQVIDVDSALDLLAERKAVFLVTLTRAADGTFTADKTLAQITEAYNNGAALQCVYTNDKEQWETVRLPLAYIRSDLAHFSAFVTPAQGETQFVSVNCSSGSGGDVWHDYSTRLTGADVDYSGKVGRNTVSTVAEALDALVVGAPLDMSADYAASGAATVQAWATMAKTGDATRYRVAAGRYSISDEDYEIGYLITIIDTPGVSYRTVWVASVTDFAFVDCYTALDPGEDVQHVVAFDTESNLLEINGQLVTLPAYTETYKGRLLTIGEDGTPQWATKPPYKVAEIACQYSDINGYEADTLAGALQLIAQDLSGLRPPHIVLNVAVASGVGELGSATENGTAISLTNASGAADYTALLAAINSAVPKGGSVEMYVDSDGYYSGMICRRPDSVDIIFLDVANPLDFNDALSFYRCHIWATGVEITNVEV